MLYCRASRLVLLITPTRLSAESFIEPFHRIIWRTVEGFVSEAKPTAIRFLRKHPNLSNRTDELREIADAAVTKQTVSYFVRDLVDLVNRRKLQRIAALIEDKILISSPTDLAEEVMAELSSSLGSADPDDKKWKHANEIMLETVKSIEESQERRGRLIGYSTGIGYLNRLTGGLQGGRVYVIAGRPAKGKSVMPMQIASYAARHGDVAAAFFSLEMPNHELGQRLIASEAKVPIGEIMNGVDDGEGNTGIARKATYEKIMMAATAIAGAKIHFRDYGSMSVLSLQIETRKIIQTTGAKIIALDYLQLMEMRGGSQDRRLAIGEITKACKRLAKQFGVVFIVVSQLGCTADGRQEISLSDLADSDEIGRDADVVACLNDDQNLHVIKNRSGGTALIPLHFDGPTFTFTQGQIDG